MNCCSYDPGKIGELIGKGSDKKVYLYGDTEVIKFSTNTLLFGKTFSQKLQADYHICKKYMPEFVADTYFVCKDCLRARHVEIQSLIKGQPFCFKSSKVTDKTKRQFRKLLSQAYELKKETGTVVDLAGNWGIFFNKLSNIIVTPEGDLKIIDTSLLESRTSMRLGFLLEPVMWFVSWRQERLLKKLEKMIL